MRTKSGDKELLKAEILKDSIKTFKKFGRAGAPVDQIMKRAGLTSGALYSHFKGKDDLFYQATLMDLDQLIVTYEQTFQKEGQKGLKKVVDSYLSEAHLQNAELGCLFVALGSDLHREKSQKKSDLEIRFERLIELIAMALESGALAERRKKASMIFSTMIGTMSVARLLQSTEAAKETLKIGRSQIHQLME